MTSSSSPESPATALPRGSILGLAVAGFASGMSLRVTDPLLPRLVDEFSLSIGAASWAITAFSLAYGVAQLLFGPLGDRFGKYRVIAWGCLACALTTLACALAPNFASLLIARALAGVTAASAIPLAMAWIGDVIDYEHRQPVLARFLIGQIMGISSGVLLGGFAADHLNWRVPFFGVALLFLLVGLYLLWLHPRLPARARLVHTAQGNALQRLVSEFAQVLRLSWARVVLLTVFFEGVFMYGAFAFIVAHLHWVHGISVAYAGAIVMLFGAGGFLYAMAARHLVRRLGEPGMCQAGGVLVALSLLGIAVSPYWWTAIPCCAGTGLGFYMLHNTLQLNATQMAPQRRGAAVAALVACFFLGQSLGVALSGVLIGVAGSAVVIATGAIGVLAVSLNFSRLKRRVLRAQVP